MPRNYKMIDCKAQIKNYQVRALDCLDKEIRLTIIITEKEKKLQEILQQLALIKADKLVELTIQ